MKSKTTSERPSVQSVAEESTVSRLRNRLEGPYTLGETRAFWIGFALLTGYFALYPLFVGAYGASQAAYFFITSLLGLSLSIVWGYTGIFSFGQVAFYGVAGYVFGIVGINIGGAVGSMVGFVVSILVAALFALILGYFMFYGGISDVFIAIITLVVTLVFETFMSQTAGEEWTIGQAPLGGANGMTNIPDLILGVGNLSVSLTNITFYYFAFIVLLAMYLGARVLLNGKWGHMMVAIRENKNRTEMLGYNTKKIQLLVFTVGGAIAGLSGALYASWGNFISPSVFGLSFAVLPIIWVATGGRKYLEGAILGTILLVFLSQQLSLYGASFNFIILGTLLAVVVLFLPEGVVPELYDRLPNVNQYFPERDDA